MEPEPEFEFVRFVGELNDLGIRFLIIGRHAVIQYNAPLMTMDYDFWIDSDDKEKVLAFLIEKKGYEGPSRERWDKPLITVYAGLEKLDLFFIRKMQNREGKVLTFEACYEKSVLKEDEKAGLRLRIPTVDDLIALKKMRKTNPKDAEDLRYLAAVKRGAKAGRSR